MSLIFSLFALNSCSSPGSSGIKIDAPIKGAIESENDNKKNIKTPSSWHLIEGVMGLYASTVIMELNIGNSIVKGRYFYAKHQKYIDLNGTIDKSGEINLTETYQGKKTGFINFVLEDKIKGTWKATPDSRESQIFEGTKVTSLVKEEFKPVFSAFEYTHITRIYKGPNDEPDEYDVTGRLTFNTISNSMASFHLSVNGANGHSGSIEGIAHKAEGIWTFYGENECKLTIQIVENKAIIDEDTCNYYHGNRAYFQGTLEQVK
ncbi:MAG: hypothetical protein MK105_12195 [Crocinitomicaceae bacterium]|nr:hypothetical protein [Crocinitomicaceae bacterium]